MTGNRRQARVIALLTLFEADVTRHPVIDVLARHLAEEEVPEQASGYARHLVNGVWAERDKIDALVARAAPAWPIEQISGIDRNILRIAIFEALFDNMAVPDKVAINEAVELAKEYGGEHSPRFVNGVLGTVVASYP